MGLRKIDSHQHFWKYDTNAHSWMNEEMKSIQRDFLPKDLKPILEKNGFEGCIAVQASQTISENTYLLSLAEESDFIKGIVGWVDLQSKSVSESLEYYKQFPKIKGFRHVLQDEPDLDFMLRPAFLKGIGKLQDFGFTYDILIFPEHLPNAYLLAKSFSYQPFILDHIAKPQIKTGNIRKWKKDIEKFSRLENVYCKVSGMVTEAEWHFWKKGDFKPYLDIVFDSFGSERVMFGSDWPVCTLSATYDDVLDIATSYASQLSKTEQAKFFGQNASKCYNLV